MKKQSKYREIRKLIVSTDIDKALTKMKDIAESLEYIKSTDTIILLQSRFNTLNKKITKGIIDKDEESIERNQITNSALEEIRNLEEKDTSKELTKKVNKVKELTEDDFFRIAIAANIVVELEKIKEQFYVNEWEERRNILNKLFKYSDYDSIRVSKEVFSFLSNIASSTRSGMKSDVADAIESLIIHYFPYFERGKERENYENFAFQCIQIGFSIFYDSAIYLNDFKVGSKGLQIMKWIYLKAKERDNQVIMERVLDIYEELEQTLDRPEIDDLELAKEVLQVFKNDLNNWGIFPIEIPDYILEIV